MESEIQPAISRAEAEGRILPYVRLYTEHNFKGITHEAALRLLGEVRFNAMLDDRIRSQGPVVRTVYPWNVVDYLSTADDKIAELVKAHERWTKQELENAAP